MPKFDVNIDVEANAFFCYAGESAIEAPSAALAREIAKERVREEVRDGALQSDLVWNKISVFESETNG